MLKSFQKIRSRLTYTYRLLAVKNGANRTAELPMLFRSRFGRPEHTFLLGASLGAGAAMRLVEQYPHHYDGILTDSGIVGGVLYQLDFYQNLRVLFNYFYPGILPEGYLTMEDYQAQVMPQVIGAIQADPSKARDMAAVDQIELQYADDGELATVIAMGLMFALWEPVWSDVSARVDGKPFFDNDRVLYTGSANDHALNAGIARFRARLSTRAQIASWYEPSGRLRIPMLTLHARRDPVVTLIHETRFAGLVNPYRASTHLLQRIDDRFGHMAFDETTVAGALNDLAAWVRTGVKPAS